MTRQSPTVIEPSQAMLIGAEDIGDGSAGRFETIDPSTGAFLASVPLAGESDVDNAVSAASAALADPAWKSMSPDRRGTLIQRFADLIEGEGESLAELDALDAGKPITASRAVDIPGAVAAMRYAAGWPTKLSGSVLPVSALADLAYTRRAPVGVCALIIPWNFPVQTAVWKMAPALAAGCTMVLKPAEQSPLSALRLGRLALEAGIPPGVVNVITGDGSTGALLAQHPGVNKISFTGSTAVGREIASHAGQSLKHVTLELGGKSANVIFPDADLKRAVSGAWQAAYFNAGQMCIAGSRLIVHESVKARVVSMMQERAAATRIGPALSAETQFGPVIGEGHLSAVMRMIDTAESPGAKLMFGGERIQREGCFIEPTLIEVTDPNHPLARQEVFGPVLTIQSFDESSEAIRLANDSEYGLAAGLWTKSLAVAHAASSELQAGTIYVNGWGKMDPAAPFGGTKASGLGREHGPDGVDAYLQTTTYWVSGA